MNHFQPLALLLFVGSTPLSLVAQKSPFTSAVPFITITTDARSSGMGEAGVALSQEAFAVFHNPSAGLFAKEGCYIATARSSRAKDNVLFSLGGYYRFSTGQSLAAGIRHFSHPRLSITDDQGNILEKFTPREWALDIAYGRLLTANMGTSLTFRYIHSDLGSFSGSSPGNAFAFDAGLFYRKEIPTLEGAHWALGIQLANIGSKIKYLEESYSLPGRITAGVSAHVPFSDIHQLHGTLQTGYHWSSSATSYVDAGIGMEYIFRNYAVLRGGYHAANKDKGDESYATAGCGLRLNLFHADFSHGFLPSDSSPKNRWNLSIGFSL